MINQKNSLMLSTILQQNNWIPAFVNWWNSYPKKKPNTQHILMFDVMI